MNRYIDPLQDYHWCPEVSLDVLDLKIHVCEQVRPRTGFPRADNQLVVGVGKNAVLGHLLIICAL